MFYRKIRRGAPLKVGKLANKLFFSSPTSAIVEENVPKRDLNATEMMRTLQALSPRIVKQLKQLSDQETNMLSLKLISDIKEELERKNVQYYLPEIMEVFKNLNWHVGQGIKSEESLREGLSELRIRFTEQQLSSWKELFLKEKVNDGNITHDEIVREIDTILTNKNAQIVNHLKRNPFEKDLLVIINNLLETIESLAIEVSKEKDSKLDLETAFRNKLYNNDRIKIMLNIDPTLKEGLFEDCIRKIPFIDPYVSKELQKIVNNWYNKMNFTSFLKPYEDKVAKTLDLERMFHSLFEMEEIYCADTMRTLIVDYSGIKINLLTKVKQYDGWDDHTQYQVRRKSENIIYTYQKLTKNVMRIIPVDLQNANELGIGADKTYNDFEEGLAKKMREEALPDVIVKEIQEAYRSPVKDRPIAIHETRNTQENTDNEKIASDNQEAKAIQEAYRPPVKDRPIAIHETRNTQENTEKNKKLVLNNQVAEAIQSTHVLEMMNKPKKKRGIFSSIIERVTRLFRGNSKKKKMRV
ncbi:MAG: hypothetical protein IC227_05820 [Enterococcus lacertideformus]|uniref:Uncharacterized protein n=1 Tax=Enterococcus lacertideformus TaxID=2771493 RepID=A0A931AYJ1_9ENTE|nr:hypothetical protein [Enterococcus lacertideformus]